MKNLLLIVSVLFALACKNPVEEQENKKLNKLAGEYVRLGLTIGQYDEDFVDAYYGPDSLKPSREPEEDFPKDSLVASVNELMNELGSIAHSSISDSNKIRANWMYDQLVAFNRRIRIFSEEYESFDDESKALFGVVAPVYEENHFKALVKQLDGILPGKGNVNDRFQRLASKFVIPKDKLEQVTKAAIAEARKRTKSHYQLPAGESFTLEFVTDKPWSGYNWYKGNYRSVIQINTDTKSTIDRAIDVGSHESYPGHHVYNMLLEKHLYHDRGWVELSLYPLFSPQSLIAEGSANYGIEVAFPGNDKVTFAKTVLLPMAGRDTTGVTAYFSALAIKGKLNYARNEVARGLINDTMTRSKALSWLKKYCLMNNETAEKSLDFIKKYRSYVINYNYGQDLIKRYVEQNGGTAQAPEKRWEIFGKLLSEPVSPSSLVKR
ncbi:hypothetical protein BDE36_0823 [Arcticibacter tournemirensis]|uniref:DUF885 domain-containing protein n=1 Tax=Arcticibacter tournemirensis TaxID=699437 RepID=A0A5M9H001_9SPHI|nr:hypothetical protein [Arcticibacter tournemirensis]KAA8478907.1 hypothetical protein F1649_17225 [Arcticibacter tournemirensis]TQM49126.1 hypothetical protein BDE36_0823 [Arcticibacter tournemirensis]